MFDKIEKSTIIDENDLRYMESKIIFFEQIEKFNGIGCFVKDFIEQAHQFGMLDIK